MIMQVNMNTYMRCSVEYIQNTAFWRIQEFYFDVFDGEVCILLHP
jgi:hypothetical protein